ncbi:MAG: hypothetical protein NSGCLCUN01_03426 [uncultured Clostridium sp.]
MAKSKKRKNKAVNKKASSIKNKKVIKEENNIKAKGPFMNFMSKKWPRIILHIITAIIWIFFLADFLTFQQSVGFPNPILSILALVVLMLEYAVSKGLNDNSKK